MRIISVRLVLIVLGFILLQTAFAVPAPTRGHQPKPTDYADITTLEIVNSTIGGVAVDPSDVEVDIPVTLVLMRGKDAELYMRDLGVEPVGMFIKLYDDGPLKGVLIVANPLAPSVPGESDEYAAGAYHFIVLHGKTASDLYRVADGHNVYLDTEARVIAYLKFTEI